MEHISSRPPGENEKIKQLNQYRETNTGGVMTSDAGLKITNSRWSLRAGKRGLL